MDFASSSYGYPTLVLLELLEYARSSLEGIDLLENCFYYNR